jgi:hypothetical protein
MKAAATVYFDDNVLHCPSIVPLRSSREDELIEATAASIRHRHCTDQRDG